jgi:hypothetical protein
VTHKDEGGGERKSRAGKRECRIYKMSLKRDIYYIEKRTLKANISP